MCIGGRFAPGIGLSADYVSVWGRPPESQFSAPLGDRQCEEMGACWRELAWIGRTAALNLLKVYVSDGVPLLFMTLR